MVKGRALTEALYPVISEPNGKLESKETQKKFLSVLKENNIRDISHEAAFVNIVADSTGIVQKSLPVIKYFLNQLKVDVNCYIGTKDTALHMACSLKSPSKKIIKLLIEHEADPNIYNYDNKTPLIIACENHKIKLNCLELILDTSLKNDRQEQKYTKLALRDAIETYISLIHPSKLSKFSNKSPIGGELNPSSSAILYYHDADTKNIYRDKLKDKILLFFKKLDINTTYEEGKTLLHIIAKNKNDDIECVQLLLDQGINQSVLDKHGHSALYYAEKNQNVNICNFLSPQTKSARNTGDKGNKTKLTEQKDLATECNNEDNKYPGYAKDTNSSSNAPNLSKKDLNEFSKDKLSFIDKYRSLHSNLSEDNIYSLLLNTAIVLKDKEIIKYILDISHSENILTQVDELNCSPISRALYSGDKEILDLVKGFIDKQSVQKVALPTEDFNNIRTVLEFSQFEDLSVEKCLNDYLRPLYSDESISSLEKTLLGENNDIQGEGEHLSFSSIDDDKFLFDETDFQEPSSSIYVSGNHYTSADY